MSFPTPTAVSQKETSDVTTHHFDVPSGVAAGKRLTLLICHDGGVNNISTHPSGFVLGDRVTTINLGGNGGASLYIYSKICDGSEANGTFVTSGAETSTTLAILHDNAATTQVEATSATGTGTSVDPASLNPSGWGTEDTEWLVWIVTSEAVSQSGWTGPSGYTSLVGDQSGSAGTSDVQSRAWYKDVNAASEDPGSATISSVTNSIAVTIAVRPAAQITVDPPGSLGTPYEALGYIAQTSAVGFESLQQIPQTSQVSDEALGIVPQTGAVGNEAGGFVPQSQSPAMEAQGHARFQTTVAWESLLPISQTFQQDYEYGIEAELALSNAYEALGLIATAPAISHEASGTVSSSLDTAYESLLIFPVSQTADFGFEALFGLKPTLAVSQEASGKISQTASVAFESLKSALMTSGCEFEVLCGATGELAIFHAATGFVIVPLSHGYESLRALAPTSSIGYESGKSAANTQQVSFESLVRLISTNAPAFESAGSAVQSLRVRYESLKGASRPSAAAWESLERVLKAVVAAMESTGRVRQTQIVGYEFDGPTLTQQVYRPIQRQQEEIVQ